MKYNEIKEVCPNCKKRLSVFTELPVIVNNKYSYTCPYCNKQASFTGSISFPVDSLPKNTVFAKLA